MPPPDWAVSADADRTLAVLCELVANAFEHGRPPVEVSVTTEGHPSLPEIPLYCVQVVDHGDGIPREFRPHVFEFGWSSAVDHSGMGLSSCLYVAQRQGGTLDYLDQSKGGAHFRLFLPLLERRDED
jgi:signal transduction histidine kinase